MVASKLHTFQVPMKRWNRARPINDLHRLSSPFVRLDSWTVCVNSPLSLSAVAAEKDGTPVFKFPRWRVKGKPIPEVVDAYKAVGAELNVMPFCSQFIPMNIIDHPKHGSIIYHPSILPLHRGASAINWWERVIALFFSFFFFSSLSLLSIHCYTGNNGVYIISRVKGSLCNFCSGNYS